MNALVMGEMRAIKNSWLIWYTLGFQDIQLRYRRSALGPLWLTLSTAIMIYSMGFLYGHLFKLDLKQYFPYLATGFICWSFIATLINESSTAYIDAANYIQNQECYYSVFMMRLILRNAVILFHNFLAFIPIALIFQTGIGFNSLLIFPGLFVICLNAFLWGSTIAVISTRYRDIEQIIGSVIQVVFFVTPIMWMPKLLPERVGWVFKYNPFAQFLTILRNPLLNQPIGMHAVAVVSVVTVVGFYLYVVSMNKYRDKIVFWL